MLTLSAFSTIVNKLAEFATSYGLRIIGSILIIALGWVITGVIAKFFRKALSKTKLDISLIGFLVRIVDIFLKAMIILSALSNLGISTTGLIATFSAAAVAVSLALKDSLGNIAGGIMMLITHSFSTGDYIEAGGYAGTVLRIDVIHTVLLTVDNKQVIIPNGQLVNMSVIDYFKEKNRRVDLNFGISYDNDSEKAKEIIMETVKSHPMVLSEPDPFVRVSEYADSAVIITLRVWCESENYWNVYFDLLEQIRKAFDENGIVIPYNQLDVHVINE